MERDQVKAAFDAVCAEREELCKRVAVLDERSRLLYELANTFDDEVPAVAARPKPLGRAGSKRTPLTDDERRARDAERKRAKRPKMTPEEISAQRREIGRKRAAERVACPDCGEMFAKPGLGPHRAKKHPGSAAKPVELPKAEPVPERDPIAVSPTSARAPLASVPDHDEPAPAKVHQCSDCNYTVALGELDKLAKHTDREHRRRLLQTERMAVLPGEAA